MLCLRLAFGKRENVAAVRRRANAFTIRPVTEGSGRAGCSTKASSDNSARAHPLAEKDAIARAELSDDAFVLHPARPEPSVTGLIVNALAR
ncbi:MAG: hypothetical protein ACK5E1_14565, partial [Bradyrhizobium sp.]